MTSDKLEQIKKLFNKEYKHRFMMKVGNQFKSFNVEDIAFFISHQRLIFLFMHVGECYPVEYAIDLLESILNPV